MISYSIMHFLLFPAKFPEALVAESLFQIQHKLARSANLLGLEIAASSDAPGPPLTSSNSFRSISAWYTVYAENITYPQSRRDWPPSHTVNTTDFITNNLLEQEQNGGYRGRIWCPLLEI